MKAIDNGLSDHATRGVETGSGGSDATLYGWRMRKPPDDGHNALVAVRQSDLVVAAYRTVTLSGRWPE